MGEERLDFGQNAVTAQWRSHTEWFHNLYASCNIVSVCSMCIISVNKNNWPRGRNMYGIKGNVEVDLKGVESEAVGRIQLAQIKLL